MIIREEEKVGRFQVRRLALSALSGFDGKRRHTLHSGRVFARSGVYADF